MIIKFKNFGKAKCVDCEKVFTRHSPNHIRCCKCAGWYVKQPRWYDVVDLDTSIHPKRTWGKKKPDTISRSALFRRRKLKKLYW